MLGKAAEDTLPGEWEDIKDKLLHLYGVGFAGIDPIATGVHKRHFFNCNMLFQPFLELPVRLEGKKQKFRGMSTSAGQGVSASQNHQALRTSVSTLLVSAGWGEYSKM